MVFVSHGDNLHHLYRQAIVCDVLRIRNRQSLPLLWREEARLTDWQGQCRVTYHACHEFARHEFVVMAFRHAQTNCHPLDALANLVHIALKVLLNLYIDIN